MDIFVISSNELRFGEKSYRCSIGKGGFVAAQEKCEGDEKTPRGIYPLREIWYRPDKVPLLETGLPLRAISHEDGWCDDPAHAEYNKHIIISSRAREGGRAIPPTVCGGRAPSFERMWREDDCYDLIVPIGYNDKNPQPGRGSAIFLHVAKPDYGGTEGCVALAKEDLLVILPQLAIESRIHIVDNR